MITAAIIGTGIIFLFAIDAVNWGKRLLFPSLEAAVPVWVSNTFFAYLCFYLIGIVFPFLLFLGWIFQSGPSRTTGGAAPFVSIIIPVYNEQGTITKSVRSALEQDYPNYEVIVVNDGSLDFTPYTVNDDAISLIHLRRNRGKAAALNAGIDQAKGEIIVFSDSDSRLEKDALRRLVEHFIDPAVGAVAGKIEVDVQNSLLDCWQTLEYIFGQVIVKLAQVGSGASAMVCPGPVCAIRRRLLLELGGYKDRSVVEDFDITLEIIDNGYRVAYEPRAIAWTNTPRNWGDLRLQRLRWYRGNLKVFSLYRHLFLRTDSGSLGIFWLPYALSVGFGGILLEAALLIALPFLLYFSGAALESLALGLVFMVVIELLTTSQYLIALALEGKLRPALAFAALISKPYHLFLAWIRLVSITRELKNREITWNG